MAYAETRRSGVKFYSVSLSTSVENISDSTARIHWTATVDFGNWYYFGVRLHVGVGGVERASGTGYTTRRGQRAVTVSGYTDAARRDGDYAVWCTAWTTSETVSGYGGVGSTTSCGENASIQRVPAYRPDPPTDLTVTESSDSLTSLAWANHPNDSARKYYTGVNVYRHTDGGATEQLYGSGTISNYRDASTSANHYYDYDVRARWRGGTSDMTNSVRVYKTPAAPSSVDLARLSDGGVSLTVHGADIPAWITGLEVRATADGGKTYAVRPLELVRGDGGIWTASDTSAPGGDSVVYEVRTYREKPVDGSGDTVFSAWCPSNAVATICPPHAPAVNGLNPAYPAGSTVEVSWTRSHPDGTAQSAAQVEITRPDGSAETKDVTGASSSISLVFSDKGSWRIRVRTKGSDPSWGAWSGYAAFTVADPPQAFFSNPGEDGESIVELPIDVSWSVVDSTGVTMQRLRVVSSSGALVDTYPASSSRAYHIGSGLENKTEYRLELTVRGGSGLSATVSRTFRTEWLAPATPLVNVSFSDDLAATVTVRDGISEYYIDRHRLLGPMRVQESGDRIRFMGGASLSGRQLSIHDLPSCESFDVVRVLPDGSRRTIASGLKSGQSVIDRLPPLNVPFDYIAIGHASSGTTSETVIEVTCPCAGFAVNFGPDAGAVIVAEVGSNGTPDYSRAYDHDVTEYHFLGVPGDLPIGYPSGKLDVSETWSFSLDGEQARKASALFASKPHGWLRSHDGERSFARIKPSVSRDSPIWYKVQLDTTREVWREPNG